MRAIIFGSGQMGMAAAYAMDVLGFDTTLAGLSKDLNAPAREKIGNVVRVITIDDLDNLICKNNFDVCISAAPYKANIKWASWCKERRIPYCDLGGNQECSEKIQKDLAHLNPTTPVFTDLGLAPGLANIIAEKVWLEQTKRSPVYGVSLRVGGLPSTPNHTSLNYSLVFSVDGLLNEYSGKCQTLRNGEVTEYDALTGLKPIKMFGREYEVFHTSGGLSKTLELMQNRGVQHLDYRTIRYPGHCKLVNFLINECKAPNFGDLMYHACPPVKNDKVIIQVVASSNVFGLTHSESVAFELEVFGDDNWSAMQKMTAFPTAVIASLMAEKRWKKPVMDYSDVPYDEFSAILNNYFSIDINKLSVYDAF